jgi:flagellar motor switch protein FliN/FliY
LASDLSNIFKDEIENTLASLLAKTIKVNNVEEVSGDLSFSSEQCVKTGIKFEFSSISPIVTFYTPTHSSTKFEHFMLGGMMPEKDHIDDEIVDAVNEIISNICGSIVTASNAQGFGDLGNAKSEAQGSEIVECSGLSGTANAFNFEIDMDGDVIHMVIVYDDAILPHIGGLRGEEAASAPAEAPVAAASSSEAMTAPMMSPEGSALSSLLGDNAIENLKLLFNIKLRLSVRLGTKVFLLKDILRWDIGEIIELDQMVNEPLDILINGVKVGEGEAVIVEGKFGIKIRSIGSEEDRLNQISLGKK